MTRLAALPTTFDLEYSVFARSDIVPDLRCFLCTAPVSDKLSVLRLPCFAIVVTQILEVFSFERFRFDVESHASQFVHWRTRLTVDRVRLVALFIPLRIERQLASSSFLQVLSVWIVDVFFLVVRIDAHSVSLLMSHPASFLHSDSFLKLA